MRGRFKLLLPLLILLSVARSASHAGDEKPPYAAWKPGTGLWTMSVTTYADGEERGRSCFMRAWVIGNETAQGADCWRVVFMPEKVPLMPTYYVAYDKQTGWLRNVSRDSGLRTIPEHQVASLAVGQATAPQGPWIAAAHFWARRRERLQFLATSLQTADKASWLKDPQPGYPLELFPLADFENADAGVRLTRKKVSEKETLLEWRMEHEGRTTTIQQRWLAGATWWWQYDRYVNGKKELSATVPLQGTESYAQKFPLRGDPRLSARIMDLPTLPTFASMLEKIEKATGLKLTLDKNLENHRPELGNFQGGKNGWIAWQLMEVIEKRQLKDGRWRKTDLGYQLEGTSAARLVAPPPPPVVAKLPTPAPQVTVAVEPPPPSKEADLPVILLVAGVVLLAATLGAVVSVWWYAKKESK
jgi:hypothetical protein